ncbi:MAG: hypothetical protein ABL977_09660 [Candidatus Eisenbacteria bacterium]
MRLLRPLVPLVLLALVSLVPAAEAKKFRYSSGPKPPEDSTLAVANTYLEPIVRSRGPRVPYTNLQLTQFVADTAVSRALASAVVDSGTHAVLAPAQTHPLNFVLEHAMLKALSRRGVDVTVRRSPIPDDSLKLMFGRPGDPVLEYTLGSAKVTYLRFVGILPGRVKIERQSLVTGSISMRDPNSSRVLWTGDIGQNFVDRFARSQVALVEEERYPELKAEVPQRNADKVLEPIVVVAVVGGLVALFFQNRP